MLPVVASCCVTPEATTTWRCREVPVFGLCICGHGNSANVNTESHTESDNMMELKTDSWDAPMILMPDSFFMNHGCQVSAAEKRATWLLSMDGVLLASVIFLRNLLRQQSVEEQVDQPKHDSQCLLEKPCGIKIKSLQKVNEDGWPSRPRDVIGARLLIVPCNRHDIKHSHATCKHSAIAYRKSLKFLCHKTFVVRPEQVLPTTMHEGVDDFSQSMCL